MNNSNETYRHYIPGIDVSVERYTANVPNDGKYYIVKEGKVVQNFRSMKHAEDMFKQLIAESGFKPKPQHSQKVNPVDETLERILSAKAIFWAEGPKQTKGRGKGGKGGRGGV